MSKISKELIESYREIVIPFVANRLYKENFEGQGKQDKAEFEEHSNEILNLAIKALEQPQGEWIYHEEPDYSTEDDCNIYYYCSVCGRKIYSSTVNEKDYPFCHCGADMRKGGAE